MSARWTQPSRRGQPQPPLRGRDDAASRKKCVEEVRGRIAGICQWVVPIIHDLSAPATHQKSTFSTGGPSPSADPAPSLGPTIVRSVGLRSGAVRAEGRVRESWM